MITPVAPLDNQPPKAWDEEQNEDPINSIRGKSQQNAAALRHSQVSRLDGINPSELRKVLEELIEALSISQQQYVYPIHFTTMGEELEIYIKLQKQEC